MVLHLSWMKEAHSCNEDAWCMFLSTCYFCPYSPQSFFFQSDSLSSSLILLLFSISATTLLLRPESSLILLFGISSPSSSLIFLFGIYIPHLPSFFFCCSVFHMQQCCFYILPWLSGSSPNLSVLIRLEFEDGAVQSQVWISKQLPVADRGLK